MMNLSKEETIFVNLKGQAVCVLLRKGSKILAVSRKNNPNDFGFPGGKIDPGETAQEAIIRETKEETGLNIKNLKEVYKSVDSQGYEVTCYSADWSGKIITTEAGVVEWVEPNVLICSSSFSMYNFKVLLKTKSLNFRIEEITRRNKSIFYMVQEKFFFIWEYCSATDRHGEEYNIEFNSLNNAEEYIYEKLTHKYALDGLEIVKQKFI